MTITKVIPRTNFTSDTIVDGYPVNNIIAEAITTLYKDELGETTIFSPEYMMPVEGFLYKSKETEAFVSVINYSFNSLFVKDEKLKPIDYTKIMILTELYANTTGQNYKEKVEKVLSFGEIKQSTQEASDFSRLIQDFENLLENGRLKPIEEYYSSAFTVIEPFENKVEFNITPIVSPNVEVKKDRKKTEKPKELTLIKLVENYFKNNQKKEIDLNTLFKEINELRPKTTKPALRGTVNRFAEQGFLTRVKRGVYALATGVEQKPKRFDLLAALEGRVDDEQENKII